MLWAGGGLLGDLALVGDQAQLADVKPASSYTCPDAAGHTYIIHSLGALSTSTGVAGRDIDVTVSTIPQLVEVMT